MKDGKEAGALCEAEAAALDKATIVDLRDAWTPRLFAPAPDGTTLLMTPVATMSIYPHSYRSLRYDPFKDFDPVAHVCDFQLALVVNNELPAKSVAEYIALVKKDPKAGDYASAAAGSLLASEAGIAELAAAADIRAVASARLRFDRPARVRCRIEHAQPPIRRSRCRNWPMAGI